ncbi:MAG: ATP-dependent DNA helicase RecG [Holosporales bacterium]|jgi:ATP-dependent DNA helicase RecG|nr:ATP-dependent DNA helicase RecG [Holosporales bacterium]
MSTELAILDDIGTIATGYLQQRLKLFRKLCGNRIIDILLHMPSYAVEQIYTEQLSKEHVEKLVTTKVTITYVGVNQRSSTSPATIYGTCGKAVVEILLFNYKKKFAQKVYVVGREAYISGKLGTNLSGEFQFVNPQKLVSASVVAFRNCILNVYPLTTGLSQFPVSIAVKNAIKVAEKASISEWLPDTIIVPNELPPFLESLIAIHTPKSLTERQLNTPARRRLCFDELLAEQLTLRLCSGKTKSGNIIKNDGRLVSRLLETLPFALTQSQEKAIGEILRDLGSGKPMTRLLQGDVGSGKTIVSIITVLHLIESGYQCAVLAPTEVLAYQHYSTFASYLTALGIHVEILTANEKGKRRREILFGVASGSVNVIIGTHAIISDGVEFHNLGLVVIDEQHRFGVNQRLRLITKGNSPHILSMTATPIPRTIIMSMYGDIAVSAITEKPAGRSEIITKIIPISRALTVVESIRRATESGQKVYWVCPLIEENEKLQYMCVMNRFEALKASLGDGVEMLHGKQKASEKQAIFERFKEGDCNLLVSTTVIEVGVDVPSATVIIVENAEKFGLAQLHQLRGRVGRGNVQSYCILLYDPRLSEVARKRLTTIRESSDGFYIAEQDLLLRGGGEIFGTKQSGQKSYRTFDMYDPANQAIILDLLKQASALATDIVDSGDVGKYDMLLRILVPTNYENLKSSF